MNKVEEAIHYAVDAHGGTFRDSTRIPYILHPLEAAAIAAALTDDQDIVAAAVLHDVVEDTDRSMGEIRSRFGERVAHFVDCDTENKRPELPSEETWQIRKQETLDRIPKLSDDELIVVFADKLANLRSIWNDYLTIWEEFWKRFSQPDPDGQLWYYHGIFDACERLGDSPLYWEYKWRLSEIEKRVREYKEFGRHEENALEVLSTPGDNKWVLRKPHSSEVYTLTDEQFEQFVNEICHDSGK